MLKMMSQNTKREIVLCRRCCTLRLKFDLAIPVWQLERALSEAGFEGVGFKLGGRGYRFTPDHDECEGCQSEFRRMGYDPCWDAPMYGIPERLEFNDELQLFPEKGEREELWLKVFDYGFGSDAVSAEGKAILFLDGRINNWLVSMDGEMF